MKVEELRKLSDEQLNAKITESKKELFELRLKQSTGSLDKPSQIKALRKAYREQNEELEKYDFYRSLGWR